MFFILFAFFNKPISLAPESHLFEGIYDTIQKNKSDSTTESLSTQTMPLDVTLLDEGQITPYPINFLILNDYGQNRFEQQTLLSKSTRLPPSFHPLRQFENSILYNADRLTDSQIDLIQTSLRQDPAQLPLHQLKVTQLQLARLQQELSETLQPTENSSNQPGKLYTNLTQNIDDTKQQIDTYYQEITELNNLVQTIKIQINNLPKVNLRRTSSLSPKKTTLKQNKSHLKQQIKDIRDNKLPLLEQKLQQLELFKQQHLQENQDITQQTDTSFTKASLLRKHQINADLIMSYLHQAQFTQYPQEFQSLLPQYMTSCLESLSYILNNQTSKTQLSTIQKNWLKTIQKQQDPLMQYSLVAFLWNHQNLQSQTKITKEQSITSLLNMPLISHQIENDTSFSQQLVLQLQALLSYPDDTLTGVKTILSQYALSVFAQLHYMATNSSQASFQVVLYDFLHRYQEGKEKIIKGIIENNPFLRSPSSKEVNTDSQTSTQWALDRLQEFSQSDESQIVSLYAPFDSAEKGKVDTRPPHSKNTQRLIKTDFFQKFQPIVSQRQVPIQIVLNHVINDIIDSIQTNPQLAPFHFLTHAEEYQQVDSSQLDSIKKQLNIEETKLSQSQILLAQIQSQMQEHKEKVQFTSKILEAKIQNIKTLSDNNQLSDEEKAERDLNEHRSERLFVIEDQITSLDIELNEFDNFIKKLEAERKKLKDSLSSLQSKDEINSISYSRKKLKKKIKLTQEQRNIVQTKKDTISEERLQIQKELFPEKTLIEQLNDETEVLETQYKQTLQILTQAYTQIQDLQDKYGQIQIEMASQRDKKMSLLLLEQGLRNSVKSQLKEDGDSFFMSLGDSRYHLAGLLMEYQWRINDYKRQVDQLQETAQLNGGNFLKPHNYPTDLFNRLDVNPVQLFELFAQHLKPYLPLSQSVLKEGVTTHSINSIESPQQVQSSFIDLTHQPQLSLQEMSAYWLRSESSRNPLKTTSNSHLLQLRSQEVIREQFDTHWMKNRNNTQDSDVLSLQVVDQNKLRNIRLKRTSKGQINNENDMALLLQIQIQTSLQDSLDDSEQQLLFHLFLFALSQTLTQGQNDLKSIYEQFSGWTDDTSLLIQNTSSLIHQSIDENGDTFRNLPTSLYNTFSQLKKHVSLEQVQSITTEFVHLMLKRNTQQENTSKTPSQNDSNYKKMGEFTTLRFGYNGVDGQQILLLEHFELERQLSALEQQKRKEKQTRKQLKKQQLPSSPSTSSLRSELSTDTVSLYSLNSVETNSLSSFNSRDSKEDLTLNSSESNNPLNSTSLSSLTTQLPENDFSSDTHEYTLIEKNNFEILNQTFNSVEQGDFSSLAEKQIQLKRRILENETEIVYEAEQNEQKISILISKKRLDDIDNQINLYTTLSNHPSSQQFLDFFQDDQHDYIICQLDEGPSLQQYLQNFEDSKQEAEHSTLAFIQQLDFLIYCLEHHISPPLNLNESMIIDQEGSLHVIDYQNFQINPELEALSPHLLRRIYINATRFLSKDSQTDFDAPLIIQSLKNLDYFWKSGNMDKNKLLSLKSTLIKSLQQHYQSTDNQIPSVFNSLNLQEQLSDSNVTHLLLGLSYPQQPPLDPDTETQLIEGFSKHIQEVSRSIGLITPIHSIQPKRAIQNPYLSLVYNDIKAGQPIIYMDDRMHSILNQVDLSPDDKEILKKLILENELRQIQLKESIFSSGAQLSEQKDAMGLSDLDKIELISFIQTMLAGQTTASFKNKKDLFKKFLKLVIVGKDGQEGLRESELFQQVFEYLELTSLHLIEQQFSQEKSFLKASNTLVHTLSNMEQIVSQDKVQGARKLTSDLIHSVSVLRSA